MDVRPASVSSLLSFGRSPLVNGRRMINKELMTKAPFVVVRLSVLEDLQQYLVSRTRFGTKQFNSKVDHVQGVPCHA